AVHLADDGLVLGDARLEELFDAGQALRDILCRTGDATGVEGAHGELRARLADGLRCDDPYGVAAGGQTTIAQVAPIARRADAIGRHALEPRGAVHLGSARGDYRVHRVLVQLGADRRSLEARYRRREDAADQAVAERLAHLSAVVGRDPDALG